MTLQNDRKYTSSHEWLLDLGNGTYRVGLSDYAQSSLGDIVFIDLPQPGDAVTAETSLGDVESVKAVSEVLSPVTGTVTATNEDLSATPESINADPYGAWLIEVGSVTGFADAIETYVRDPALRASHGAESLKRAKAYDWDTINDLVIDRYFALAGRG